MICKSCGSEVSPYITECPYCGNRLRKRAPKLDRDGRVAREAPPAAGPAAARPAAPRRDPRDPRRVASRTRRWLLVVLGLVGCLLWRTALGRPTQLDHRRQAGVALVAAAHGAVRLRQHRLCVRRRSARSALFGWLLERRHGPLVRARCCSPSAASAATAATAAVYAVPGRARRQRRRAGAAGRLGAPRPARAARAARRSRAI